MLTNYTFEPDFPLLARLIDEERLPDDYEFLLERKRKDGKYARGLLRSDRLQGELPDLKSLDLNFYYQPRNERIRGWSYIHLNFVEKSLDLSCYGKLEWFQPILERWVLNLRAVPAEWEVQAQLVERVERSIAPELFAHVRPSLRAGRFTAALSAAVVFVEDRLRCRLGAPGTGLTASELAQYAFKTPGVLRPPLAHAANADDNAFLLLKGWFGLVRNLHGHQSSIAMNHDQVFAQLSGCSYVLWLIDNAEAR